MMRTVSTVPDCWKSSRRSSSVAWKDRFPTNNFAAIVRPPSPSESGGNRTLLPGYPVMAHRYMTGRDACQVDRKMKESEVDAARRAAVDRDAHTRDERGSRRYQKADQIGDVFRRRDALERILPLHFRALRLHRLASCCSLLLDQRLPARGRRRRRRHSVDENVRRGAEVRESL